MSTDWAHVDRCPDCHRGDATCADHRPLSLWTDVKAVARELGPIYGGLLVLAALGVLTAWSSR